MQYKPELYKEISDYIFKFTGIHYAEANYYQLDARIGKLMKFLEVDNEDEILKRVKSSLQPDAHQMIVDLATNNETYFFRDPVVFTQFRKEVLPGLKAKLEAGQEVNIWSAASSSGQEIYSILMAIEEEAPGLLDKKINFFASDISSQILQKAKEGKYTQLEVQRGLPIMLLSKYFKPGDDKNWVISEKFSSKVKFHSFNLLKDPYPVSKFDVVLCRNVLIYQKKENKSVILENICKALKPGGFLILGNTENTFNLTESFDSAKIDNVNFYKRPESGIKKQAA